MSSTKMSHPILAAGLIVIVAMSGLGFYLYQNGYFGAVNSTGISFQACNDHADGSQDCSTSVNVPLADAAQTQISSVSLKGASGSFTYQGTPKTWSFACVGTIAFGNGQSSPITAFASGSGTPPSSWSITITPKQWNLSTIYGANYGQKNLTAQLGSKASPCSLTVAFSELSTPMKISYRYASLAKWRVNYQASNIALVTKTSISSSQTTTSTNTTTSTSTSTSVVNTATTSQTDIWTTIITSASGGATGSQAPNGIVATLAPDYYFPSTQSVVWVYYSAAAYAQCSQGIFVSVVTPSTSVTVGRLPVFSNTWSGAISFKVVLTPNNLYLLQVLCADSASTMLFNQVVHASAATNSASYGANLPPSPYDAQYISAIQSTSSSSSTVTSGTYTYYYYTSTVGGDGATSSFVTSSLATSSQPYGCTSPSLTCLRQLSVVSVTF